MLADLFENILFYTFLAAIYVFFGGVALALLAMATRFAVWVVRLAL
jgi:uncharacterized membrane protein YccC